MHQSQCRKVSNATQYVGASLKLPDGCYVLTRGKYRYNERCLLVFTSPGECAHRLHQAVLCSEAAEGRSPLSRNRLHWTQSRASRLNCEASFSVGFGTMAHNPDGVKHIYSHYCIYVKRKARRGMWSTRQCGHLIFVLMTHPN
eukprot:3782827-Amphidinium_carterae.2